MKKQTDEVPIYGRSRSLYTRQQLGPGLTRRSSTPEGPSSPPTAKHHAVSKKALSKTSPSANRYSRYSWDSTTVPNLSLPRLQSTIGSGQRNRSIDVKFDRQKQKTELDNINFGKQALRKQQRLEVMTVIVVCCVTIITVRYLI